MEKKTESKQAFKALSKICLNNWHYIDRKVLTLNQGINFFTGHSGSGKSTVIDALQIVLYANTDGRGFFNKAAADDSDRSLIEYLRGMISVGDNNEGKYIRNRNFSTTIVLELEQRSVSESFLTWRLPPMRFPGCFSGIKEESLKTATEKKTVPWQQQR